MPTGDNLCNEQKWWCLVIQAELHKRERFTFVSLSRRMYSSLFTAEPVSAKNLFTECVFLVPPKKVLSMKLGSLNRITITHNSRTCVCKKTFLCKVYFFSTSFDLLPNNIIPRRKIPKYYIMLHNSYQFKKIPKY